MSVRLREYWIDVSLFISSLRAHAFPLALIFRGEPYI